MKEFLLKGAAVEEQEPEQAGLRGREVVQQSSGEAGSQQAVLPAPTPGFPAGSLRPASPRPPHPLQRLRAWKEWGETHTWGVS